MQKFIIYKIKNKLNNKVYIGQTCCSIEARISKHIRAKSIIGLAIKKYGINNFEIQSVFSNLTIDQANSKEVFCIKIFKCIAPRGYNLQPGGHNKTMHEVTKNKLSIINKNCANIARLKIIGDLYRANNPHPRLGKKLSLEQKNKLSKSHKGQVPWNKGTAKVKLKKDFTCHSEETKQKISQSMVAVAASRDPSSYAKMAIAKRNKPIPKNYKPIKCIELDKIYESIGHAAVELNIQRTGISMVLNGTIRTTGGYSFERVN